MSSYQPAGDGGSDASVVAQAQEKVQQTAGKASATVARYVREQTEARGRQAATELQTIAQALRRSSHALHADGNATAAKGFESVTDRIEGLSRYLGSTGGDQILRDIESFGRRKPWGMIGIGLGLGAAASRFLKASSSRRFEESQPVSQYRPVAPATSELVTGSIEPVRAGD